MVARGKKPSARQGPARRARGRRGRKRDSGPDGRPDDTLAELEPDQEQLQIENEHLREAVRLMERSLGRYADLYDLAPIGYATVDQIGMIREINQAGCALVGSPRDHLLGTPFKSLVDEVDRPLLAEHLRACRSGGSAATRLQLGRRDRTLVAVELLSRLAPGEQPSYRMAMVDMSERQAAERQRDQIVAAERAARAANEAKDRSIAMLGHELRAPLTPVLAAVGALERWPADPQELPRLCEIIRRGVMAEVRLIDDLLDVNRLTHDKMLLRREPTLLDALAREVLDTLSGELREKELWLTIELEARSHLVDGDPVRLRQVLWNLLANAIKFTPAGGRLSLRSWNRGPVVALEVSDSGIGIDGAHLERLFSPFTQVHEPGTGQAGGLGLGLAICKGIVELHGGKIAAASRGPGKGARFVVELPTVSVTRASDGPPASGDGERAQGNSRQPPATETSRPRILLVEDNVDTAAALSLALRRSGYQIAVAGSVETAMKIDLGSIDLVISDLTLPDGRGADLLVHLRKKRPIRAIALSGHGSREDVLASKAAGFAAHLTKPVELDVLTAAIESTMNGQGS